jgi:hypothetical protein
VGVAEQCEGCGYHRYWLQTFGAETVCASHLRTAAVCWVSPWLEQEVGLEDNVGVAHELPCRKGEEFLETEIGRMVVCCLCNGGTEG